MRRAYRAPGRVNLIGEHTDYNDGFVMPVAIDRHTRVVIEPRADRRLAVRSSAFDETVEIDLDAAGGGPTGHWSDYIRGVAAVLERDGHRLGGATLDITSDVPIGAGLSSSAALEVAVGRALLGAAGIDLDRTALALACQRAEHEYAGTRCGVMDQFVVCHGRPGHALLLDTRTLEMEWLPLPGRVAIVVCNTMTKHALAGSAYNERRADCEAGVRAIAVRLSEVRALRDVTPAILETSRDVLPERVYRRCRHVVTENMRVMSAATALRLGNLDAFGSLMGASHRSLRDDYDVSCAELDAMVECAAGPGLFGARMTGGGFGGCTVNLVATDAVDDFRARVTHRYRERTGKTADVYVDYGKNPACARRAAAGVRMKEETRS
jgi:galactokinase